MSYFFETAEEAADYVRLALTHTDVLDAQREIFGRLLYPSASANEDGTLRLTVYDNGSAITCDLKSAAPYHLDDLLDAVIEGFSALAAMVEVQ